MRSRLSIAVCASVLVLSAPLQAQTPAGSAFSYQGRLTDAGGAAQGFYDLRFTLHDAAAGGGQVGGTLTETNVNVGGGLFTVVLDFGVPVFTESARWLEVGVRPGGSVGAFTVLAPRQPITPAPYSLDTLRLAGKPPSDYASATSLSAVQTGLAALSSTVDGAAFLADAQTFTGDNTFTGATTLSGVATLSNAASSLAGTVRFGSTPAACTPGIAGTVRWVGALNGLELCDGAQWRSFAPLPQASITVWSTPIACGNSPANLVDTGVSVSYTSTGRSIVVNLHIPDAATGSAGGLQFRMVTTTGTEIGTARVTYAAGEQKSVNLAVPAMGLASGSYTVKLQCAADSGAPFLGPGRMMLSER